MAALRDAFEAISSSVPWWIPVALVVLVVLRRFDSVRANQTDDSIIDTSVYGRGDDDQ